MRKFYLSRDELYQEYVVKQLSQAAIGNTIGCIDETVRNYLRKFKIPSRHVGTYVRTIEIKKRMSDSHKGRPSGRMGQKCPSKVKKKISLTLKQYFSNLPKEKQEAQIKRFMNAPLHTKKPNKVEGVVINASFADLKFVGDGSFFLTFKNGKKKNPDFVYKKPEKKAIEICDFEHWHTEEEMNGIVQSYNDIGWKCLVLDANLVRDNFRLIKLQIDSFLYDK